MSITTKTVSGLDDSTSYYFNVLVKDSSGNKSAYTPLEQDTLDNTPPVPGGLGVLTVGSVSSSSVSISWSPASDSVTGQSSLQYLLYYSTSSSMDTVADIKENGTPVDSYTSDIITKSVEGLSSSTRYYFNVLVKDDAGNEAAYNKASQVTSDITSPTVGGSGIITADDVQATSISISWSKATDDITSQANIQYLVYYSVLSSLDTVNQIEANGVPVGTYESDITSRDILGLTSSTSYYFNVIAKDEAGNKSAYTKLSQATDDITVPVVGLSGQLSLVSATSTTATITWTEATDDYSPQNSLRYLLYYSLLPNLDSVTNTELNGTPVGTYATAIYFKEATGLTPSTNYYFNVIVQDEQGNKAAYNQKLVSLDTTLPVPGNSGTIVIPPASATANSVLVQWTKATDDLTTQDQLQYLVYYSTNSAMDTLEQVKANGTPFGVFETDIDSKEVTGLLAGTDYYFNIVVKDNSGILLGGPGNETVYGKQHYLTPTLDVVLASTVPNTGTTFGPLVPFTVTFIEGGYPVNDSTFTEADITVTNGSVETGSLTGTGTSWSFNVDPVIAGDVTVQIEAGKVQDTNSNNNTASNVWTVVYVTAIDIKRLGRFINGLPRDIDLDTNTLQVKGLEVGTTSPAELTKTVVELLNTINTTGLPGANVSAEAKQDILETKLVALHAPVPAFTPTTGNTSDEVTTAVLSVAQVDIPVGLGESISEVTAWGIFVGNVTGPSDIGKVLIRVSGTDNGVEDGTGDEIYGVLTESGGVYTLSYKKSDGSSYTILAENTTAKFDFYFVEVTDLYSFGVDRLLTPAIGGVVDTTSSGQVVNETQARMIADSSLQANINAEITARTLADNAEITARMAADSTLQANINAEATARDLADSTLQANIDAQAPLRLAADSTIQSAIDSTASERLSSDSSVQSQITDEQTARSLADSTLQANLNSEITARQSSDNALQGNIFAEETARTAADSLIQSNLDSDTSSRLASDSSLQGQINDILALDSSLQNSIDTEAADRLAADSVLEGNLGQVTSDRTTVDGSIGSILSGETVVRESADSTLQSNIEAEASLRDAADLGLVIDAATRSAVDSNLQVVLGVEETARIANDSDVQAALTTEAGDRAIGDAAVQSSIDGEYTARTAADSTLQSQIDAEGTLRSSADSTIQVSLNDETAARQAADSTLQVNLTVSARQAADSTIQVALGVETTARLSMDSTLAAQIATWDASVIDAPFVAATGGVTAGDVVAEGTVAGECIKANATDVATCEVVLGVALETKSAGQTVMVRTYGNATVTTDGTNLDTGKRAFVATTNGQATKTVYVADGTVVYLLGYATAAGQVFVNPNFEYINEIP